MAQQLAGRPVHTSTEALNLLYKHLLNNKKKIITKHGDITDQISISRNELLRADFQSMWSFKQIGCIFNA